MNIKSLSTTLLFISLAIFNSTAVAETLSGRLGVIWGDSQNGKIPSKTEFTLEQDTGARIPLEIKQNLINAAGGLAKIRAKQVIIETDDTTRPLSQPGSIINTKKQVSSITSLDFVQKDALAFDQQSLTGSQRYVSILCKFSDRPAEPQDWAFFNNMYGNITGQLGHYWKEVSSDNINLSGSQAYGGSLGNNGWYDLPSPRSTYVNATYPSGNLVLLFNDCVSQADAHINFSDVKGINLMFNDTIGDYAWGGGLTATLDGITKYWPTTWEPTWGWANMGTMAHEMGHSFGLPHSNNSDNDGNPYDNPWSVMSDVWNHKINDAVYGVRGKHVNAYEKDQLNWLTVGETFTAPDGQTHTLNVDSLSDSLAGAGAYRIVKVPFLNGNDYYTVEARESSGAYDGNLAGTAIIIHSVTPTRQEPAWVIDKDTPPDSWADTEGVMWKPGETFTDIANNISITVNSATLGGFQITVNRGGTIASPEIISPAPNSTLTNSSETFTWSYNNTPIQQWAFYVGNTVGGNEYLLTGGNDDTTTSATATGLPQNGSNIYTRLWYKSNDTWNKIDSTYTAATVSTPTITTPTPNSTLTSANQTFSWSNNGANVEQWSFYAGSTLGGTDYAAKSGTGITSSVSITGLPQDGSTIYVRIWFKINGSWVKAEAIYTASS